jgi:pyruvate kinase
VQAHQAAAVALIASSAPVARRLSQMRLPVWTVVFSRGEAVCRGLHFCSGVQPVHVAGTTDDWPALVRAWLRQQGLARGRVILCREPAPAASDGTCRLQVIGPNSSQY